MTELERLQQETLYIKDKMGEYYNLYEQYLKSLKKDDFSSNQTLAENIEENMNFYLGKINRYIEQVTPNSGASRFVLYGNLNENYTEFRNLQDEYMDKLMT